MSLFNLVFIKFVFVIVKFKPPERDGFRGFGGNVKIRSPV